MKKSISIFGRHIALNKIFVFIVFFLLYFIYTIVEQPIVESEYLDNDIKNFEDKYFWKIYLVLWISFMIYGFYKIEKTKEAIGELGMGLLFFLVIGYFLFNNIITTNTLFINQITSVEKENIVFEVFNYDKHISLTSLNNDKENISYATEAKFFDKINEKRKRNQLEPLNQVKHGDTVNVVFDKGLFGFKYLK